MRRDHLSREISHPDSRRPRRCLIDIRLLVDLGLAHWNVNVSTVFDTTTICDSNGDYTAPTGVTEVNSQSLRWGSSLGDGQSGLDITDSPNNQNVTTNGAPRR